MTEQKPSEQMPPGAQSPDEDTQKQAEQRKKEKEQRVMENEGEELQVGDEEKSPEEAAKAGPGQAQSTISAPNFTPDPKAAEEGEQPPL
jgi:hypothetical protein